MFTDPHAFYCSPKPESECNKLCIKLEYHVNFKNINIKLKSLNQQTRTQ